MISNKKLDVQEVLAFSGLSADTKRVVLPAVRADYIILDVAYTVTDAGISSGENFDGLIDELFIGNSNSKLVTVRRNELATLISAQHEGFTYGRALDPQPTTETECNASFVIEGPFNLQNIPQPELVLSLGAITGEFGAASAFTATVHVSVQKSESQTGYGVMYHREYRPSAVRHDVPLGPSMVREIYLGTSQTISEVVLPGSNGRGSKSPTDYEVNNTKNPIRLLNAWMTYKNASATTAGSYWIDDIAAEDYTGRVISVTLSSAGTLLLFAKNQVV